MSTLLKIRYWFEGWPVWPDFRRGFYNGGPRAFLLASECHPFFQCKLRSIDCLEFPPHISFGKCIPTTRIFNIDTPNSSCASWNTSSKAACTESKRQVYERRWLSILDPAVLPRDTQGTLHLFRIWGHCQPAVEMAPWPRVFHFQGTTPQYQQIHPNLSERKLLDFFGGLKAGGGFW